MLAGKGLVATRLQPQPAKCSIRPSPPPLQPVTPCPSPADGLALLYRTGLQFFLLAYCGSNLREAARLLKVCVPDCHLQGGSVNQ